MVHPNRNAARASLQEETIDADMAAIEEEVAALRTANTAKPARIDHRPGEHRRQNVISARLPIIAQVGHFYSGEVGTPALTLTCSPQVLRNYPQTIVCQNVITSVTISPTDNTVITA